MFICKGVRVQVYEFSIARGQPVTFSCASKVAKNVQMVHV